MADSSFLIEEVGVAMNIQIVGAGAVGLLVASYLQQSGINVTLVVRSEEQRKVIAKQGVTLIRNNSVFTTKELTVVRKMAKDAPITIVTTKSYHLQHLYNELAELPESAAILFMQNGLAHYEPAISLPQRDIAFSSVQFGALKENNTTVRHTGVGIWKLAIGKGAVNAFEPLMKCQSEPFPIELVHDAYAMLFEKALLNCFINPLTAILQVKNGVLIENKAAYTLLEQLYNELLVAFPNEMVDFPLHSVVSLCEKTAENTSSMLMDRLSRRPSEVDAIVRPILERAKKSGQHIPTLQMLYTLMMALEMERERQ